MEITDTLSKARELFETSGVHHLPVVQGEELVGIFSWTDMLRISFGDYGNQDSRSLDVVLDQTYELKDVMQQHPVTMPINGTVRDAANVLGTERFHSVPVVDGNKLVGIVTSTDLIQYLIEQY